MQKISSLHINNFKYFPISKPINIDGKNILLYGENGSGKSSIFWALYTLLECANKPQISDIQKYFDKNNPNSLVNIHAQVDANGVDDSFINITLDNAQEFNVSFQDTSINTLQDAKISNMASDFLNYRLLQSFHIIKHSDEINLFPVFEDAVLNYVQFPIPILYTLQNPSTNISLVNAGEIWSLLKKGPYKNYTWSNGRRNDSYPLKTKHKTAYQEFMSVSNGFYNNLSRIITSIKDTAKNILKDKLGYDISFHLELQRLNNFKTTVHVYSPPRLKIKLIIDDFEGKGPVINKPQSFLNEAKLTAMSLSIRLAFLEQRLANAPVKILVLDDLLVSFDMSNRDRVTKIILNEHAWWFDEKEIIAQNRDKGYQTFILTHDRSYFTWVKHEIDNLPIDRKNNWKVIEMYVKDKDPHDPNDFEKPVIFNSETELAIAHRHFNNFDYPSAANYLRKHAEKALEWLPPYCWIDPDKKDKSNSKQDLFNIVENGIGFLREENLDTVLFLELRKYVRVLLNPLSHADVGVNRYKEEINEMFRLFENLEAFMKSTKWDVAVAGTSDISLVMHDILNGNTFIGTYELKDSIYRIEVAGVPQLSTFRSKLKTIILVDSMGSTISKHDFVRNVKKMFDNYKEFCNSNHLPQIADWQRLLLKADGSPVLI